MQITIGAPAVGDQFGQLNLASTLGRNITATDLVGKPLAMTIYPTENAPGCTPLLEKLRDRHGEFESRGVRVVGISVTPADQQLAFVREHQIPYPLLSDAQLAVSGLLGALKPAGKPSQGADKLELTAVRRTILFGPDLRILKIYDIATDADAHVAQLLGDIDSLVEPDPPRRMQVHAPVLLIPNVLPPELCARLIEVWETQGNVDSGFMRQIDGKTVGMTDYSHKIRRDHFLTDSPELAQLKKYVTSRIVPPMLTSFNYAVSRFEDFRIACYDASRGGYFRPHRDNTTDGTAHRRFAMSLLLNNDYEGGSLRFPEYGLHEYRPKAGSAVIFSCSLLHEATDVTAGRRFVLLSFFYGEAEAKIREEYNRRTGGAYRAAQAQTGA